MHIHTLAVDWDLPIKILDILVAVAAIILSIWAIVLEKALHREFKQQRLTFAEHKRAFEEHKQEFENQKKEIGAIVSSVSTRYIADWPTNLKDLAELISHADADNRLFLQIDSPGYGHFSNPRGYNDYLCALKAAISKGVKVQILVCSEAIARKCIDVQFAEYKGPNFNNLKSDPRYPNWLNSNGDVLRGYHPETYDEFVDALMYCGDDRSHQLAAQHAAISTMAINSSNQEDAVTSWMRDALYFWIIPKREMIFTFPRYYGAMKGYAFRTVDRFFMDTFELQFEAKWGAATLLEEAQRLYPGVHERMSRRVRAATLPLTLRSS